MDERSQSGVKLSINLPDSKAKILVFHGPDFPEISFLQQIRDMELKTVNTPEDLSFEGGILLLDKTLAEKSGLVSYWRRSKLWPLLVITEDGFDYGDFLVPRDWPRQFLLKALEAAVREFNLLVSRRALSQELDSEHEKLFQLTHIGLALSAERDLSRLLTTILAEGRRWACCDAASLFLVDRSTEGKPQLVFKLVQNDSVPYPFEEQRIPLNKESLVGFVAVTGEILNLPDVYDLSNRLPFHFQRSFDESVGYRTRSVVTIPMKNHNQEVIGVLQFLNRKTSPDIALVTRDITERHTRPFTEDVVVLLKALASQAAVAIGNTLLVNQIQELFEGFVTASVMAIEQRDPTTSGHSFRVADLTTGLAHALPRSEHPRFNCISFNDNQIKEIRYASLLHDFGKVGVREGVLIKAKKLPPGRLEQIWHRFELFKEQLQRQAADGRVEYLLKNGRDRYQEWAAQYDQEIEKRIQRLTHFYAQVAQADEPSILTSDGFEHLQHIRETPFLAGDRHIELLTNDEFLALSVRRGSLTLAERKEIESHVVHTFNFLNQIPWTKELKQVPSIAMAHHEKLDGSGYPYGWDESKIPLESKIMTIADIFDALTASDRPYKKAMPALKAMEILEMEADNRLLDKDLVKIFIEARVFEVVNSDQKNRPAYPGAEPHAHSVCDQD